MPAPTLPCSWHLKSPFFSHQNLMQKIQEACSIHTAFSPLCEADNSIQPLTYLLPSSLLCTCECIIMTEDRDRDRRIFMLLVTVCGRLEHLYLNFSIQTRDRLLCLKHTLVCWSLTKHIHRSRNSFCSFLDVFCRHT